MKALETADGANITDRKIAERALAVWIQSLTSPAPVANDLTFRELFEKFVLQKDGQKAKTKKKYAWVKYCFDNFFPGIWKMRVVDLKPSHLAEFFAKRRDLKATTFNEMTMCIRAILEVAVADEIIPSNPYAKISKGLKRKRREKEQQSVPTIKQCEKIVEHVRGQLNSSHADKSADMLALMHLAALGQAELIDLDWSAVKWADAKIKVKRRKTGAEFDVPIYPHMKIFLCELWERHGKPTTGPLVSITTPCEALWAACKRLGFPLYFPRDLRKARIVWLIDKGVQAETIAKWQGHSDNGILIRKVYIDVFTNNDAEKEAAQLAKIALAA